MIVNLIYLYFLNDFIIRTYANNMNMVFSFFYIKKLSFSEVVWTSSAGFLGNVSVIKHEEYKLKHIEIKPSDFR